MTPLPKRKHSKGRRNRRRAHYNLKPTTLEVCGQCKELKLPHRVCPNCGTYNARQVIDVQARAERKGRKNAQYARLSHGAVHASDGLVCCF